MSAGFDEGGGKEITSDQNRQGALLTLPSEGYAGGSQDSEGLVVVPKAEVQAKGHRTIAKVGGYHPTKGKPYLEWMEGVPFLKKFRWPDIPIFDWTCPSLQHVWHFFRRKGALLKNDAHGIMQFTRTLVGNAFKWF